jgi:hypothetical protein
MNRQIEGRRNPNATAGSSVHHASQAKVRLVAGVAINVLGAVVLFSESFRFLNAGL